MGRRTSPINKAPILGYHVINKAGGAPAPFSPTDIAGIKLWIDFSDTDTLFTDAGTTKVTADGQAIYQANDKSGNGFNVIQSTSDERPLYKTNVKNGLSVGLFDGSNDSLGTTLTGFVADQPMTAFVVAYENNYGSGTGKNPVWQFGNQGGINDRRVVAFCLENSSADAIRLYGGNTVWANTTYRTWYAWAHIYNGDSKVFDGWLNGGSISPTGSSVGALNITNGMFLLGKLIETATNYFDGYIAELVYYYGALSTANRQAVESYLNSKWSVYVPAKMQSLGSMLSFEPEEEKLWWQGADVLDSARPQVTLSWWDKASKVVDEALAKSRKWIVTTWHKIGKAIEDYFSYDEEE